MPIPQLWFLANRSTNEPGSIILPIREGSRSLLLEIQALTVSNAQGYGKRLAVGFDHNRLSLLLAILNRHSNIQCADKDVYINVVGGLKVQETAADLAVLLAIASSINNQPINTSCIAFGEVGLNGEIRPAIGGEMRLMEAHKQGFTHAIVPNTNLPRKDSELAKQKTLKISAVSAFTPSPCHSLRQLSCTPSLK